jgi:molybdenum cofactor cytidylyltransferase
MRFGPIALDQAEGKILGHHIAGPDGRRAFRKGKPLTAEDVAELRSLGRTMVYVAQVEPGDMDEDTAALRLGKAVMGTGLRLSDPATGRANLYADSLGLLRIDVSRLDRLNQLEGVTVATLPAQTAVREGKMVATLKILPYALPEATVQAAETVAAEGGPLLHLDILTPRRVGLILSGSPSAQERIIHSFDAPLRQRLAALGSTIDVIDFVALEEEGGELELAQTIGRQQAAGIELIILAGETAIMDRYDIAPRAVEAAGGEVTCFGAPVDPGNLLMMAYLGALPILGAPGCARSPKENIVDIVLPRLLVGDRLSQADIVRLGHGGLLEDVPERPMPRSRLT